MEFAKIPFKNLEPLIVDRIKSLITLVGEVFLKTVRRLVYGRLYASEAHRFRRMSNLIRELTREDFEVKRARERNEPDYFQNIPGCDPILIGSYGEVIGAKLQLVAETATSFGTTLWFTKTEKLEDTLNTLIICGQATMCFNLLRYLVELRGTPDNGYLDLAAEKRAAIDHLWGQCLEDWKRFKKDPGFMIQGT
ncbi:MAG: hypothetical protein IPL46_21645 [Saprospiraceae bacterium]|nr:hypothetical protein [Saprospiraceae bacterium]